jgi:DNA repair protein RadA/Sms
MVDCVLYLEGAGSSTTSSSDGGGGSSSTGDPLAATNSLRILRASKNRFGSCDEVGVYEMTAGRLMPVSDPSSLFLAQRSSSDDEDAEGCAIAIALEGMRAITIEIQALVVMSSGNSGYGRRTVEGIAYSRLMLLMGVLQKRCRIFLGRQDVYINVAGRMRLDRGGEGHAADLAVAVALVSSLTQVAVRADTVFIGEVGLLGELRSVAALDKRIQEARRMGFSRVITPPVSRRKGSNKKGANKKNGRTASTTSQGMEWIQCDTLMDAIEVGLVAPLPQPKRKRRSTIESSGTIPEQLGDLGLDEILDDDDDEEPFL